MIWSILSSVWWSESKGYNAEILRCIWVFHSIHRKEWQIILKIHKNLLCTSSIAEITRIKKRHNWPIKWRSWNESMQIVSNSKIKINTVNTFCSLISLFWDAGLGVPLKITHWFVLWDGVTFLPPIIKYCHQAGKLDSSWKGLLITTFGSMIRLVEV